MANAEPPPPSTQVEEDKPEPESEDKPPELTDNSTQSLDLEQLSIALNPGFSQGWMGTGDFTINLNKITSDSKDEETNTIFSLAELDQKPRVISQQGPVLSQNLLKKTPASVDIIFIVDEQGHVINPRVRSSSDPAFENPALNAVKRWIFEPGKKNGKPVRFRMLVPITFPKG